MLPDPRFATLRDEARSMAARSREPGRAWSELSSWASGKGPAAMKAAIMGFLETYGSRPESVAILPEVTRAAAMLPPGDRIAMVSLANRSFSAISGFGGSAPGQNVSMRDGRPALSLAFQKPGQKQVQKAIPGTLAAPAVQSPGIAQMLEARDRIFHVSGQIAEAKGISRPPVVQAGIRLPPRPVPVAGGRFRPVMGAADGHALVRSLIAKVRSHASEEHYLAPAAKKEAPKKTSAKPSKRKPSRRKTRKQKAAKGRLKVKAAKRKSRPVKGRKRR